MQSISGLQRKDGNVVKSRDSVWGNKHPIFPLSGHLRTLTDINGHKRTLRFRGVVSLHGRLKFTAIATILPPLPLHRLDVVYI